jgi:hypothetical protein
MSGVVVELNELELSLVLQVVCREAKSESERYDRMIHRPVGSHDSATIENARVTAGLYADLRTKLESL